MLMCLLPMVALGTSLHHTDADHEDIHAAHIACDGKHKVSQWGMNLLPHSVHCVFCKGITAAACTWPMPLPAPVMTATLPCSSLLPAMVL